MSQNLKLKSGEEGQATIAALTLMPLVLAIAGGLIILVYALSIEAKATAACRLALAKSQQEAATSLHNLMRLNPLARKASLATRAAQDSVRAARLTGNPALIGSAIATLTAAQAAQARIRAKQLFWLQKGKTSSYSATSRASYAVESELLRLPIQWANHGRPRYSKKPMFEVIPVPPQSETPEYFPSAQFTSAQEARLDWALGDSTQSQSVWDMPRLELGCAVTLNRDTSGKEDQWVPQVSTDKLLSN